MSIYLNLFSLVFIYALCPCSPTTHNLSAALNTDCVEHRRFAFPELNYCGRCLTSYPQQDTVFQHPFTVQWVVKLVLFLLFESVQDKDRVSSSLGDG